MEPPTQALGTSSASRADSVRVGAGVSSILLLLIAGSVLLGWTFEIDALKRVIPSAVAMNPLTALCFIASAVSLVAALTSPPRQALANICGLFAALVGAVVLLRYLFDWDTGIDRILFQRSLTDNVMAPTTGFNFLLSGLALVFLARNRVRTDRTAQILAVSVGWFALLVLTGYVYGVEKMYRLRDFIAMAPHTAFSFLVLAIGLLCARADHGLMARLTSDRAGGVMLRRKLLAQIGVPLILGWLILAGHRLGHYEAALGFSLFVVGVILFIALLTWRHATLLDREDTERLRVESDLRTAKAGLSTAVTERTADLTYAITAIREGLNVLGVSSSGVLESSSGLAASANQTAVSLSQTTSTVEEVRQTAQLASERARAVAEAALRAADISAAGNRAVQGTVTGMERIRDEMQSIADCLIELSEQSRAIGEIVAAVDGLADQSQLLSVNAAIEAAHAGERGKGFAVVAEQVKFLADQSRHATMRVRAILADIQKATSAAVLTTEHASKAVESGMANSSEAGDAIKSLAANVNDAASASTQIAASSREQLLGMEQVALAMRQIGAASHQNVDQAKRLESAARNLDQFGQHLRLLLERHRASTPDPEGHSPLSP